jgi:hypothetical protein
VLSIAPEGIFMTLIRDLKLATKLGLAFTLVLALAAAVDVFAIIKLAQVNSAATELSERWMPAMRVVQDLKAQIARVRTREFQYIISTDPKQMDQYDKVIANDLVDLGKMQDTRQADRHARGKSAVQRLPGHVGPLHGRRRQDPRRRRAGDDAAARR